MDQSSCDGQTGFRPDLPALPTDDQASQRLPTNGSSLGAEQQRLARRNGRQPRRGAALALTYVVCTSRTVAVKGTVEAIGRRSHQEEFGGAVVGPGEKMTSSQSQSQSGDDTSPHQLSIASTGVETLATANGSTLTMEEAVPLDLSPRRKMLADAGLNLNEVDENNKSRRGFAVPSTADEIKDAKVRWGEDSWQMKALRFINSEGVQRFLVALLLLDVMILFTELAIDAFVPSCKFVVRDAISCCPSAYNVSEGVYDEKDGHRFLGGGGGGEICAYPLEETDYQAGCDYNKHHGVHVAHKVLFWTTIAILSMFEVELVFLVYLLGPRMFCGHLAYVVDLFIVTLSLVLELLFRFAGEEVMSALPGILIVFRLWRFVRIGHGLVQSTYEVQERKIHLAVDYIEELEEIVKKYEQEALKRPKKLKQSTVHKILHSSMTKSQTSLHDSIQLDDLEDE